MKRSPIQEHTTALIKGLIAEWNALQNLDQKTVKGRLRELFILRILNKFLSNQFGIGNGVIINQAGKISKEIDIIIYDKRILPPFIQEQKISVFPIESVLAVIEVRSRVGTSEMKSYAKSATELFDEIYDPDWSIYGDCKNYLPFYCLVGFCDQKLFKGMKFNEIWSWMADNVNPLFAVCVIDQLSWLKVCTEKGALHLVNNFNEETKAFVAILLDNIRTLSQRRIQLKDNEVHKDWLSIYLRDQNGIKKIFEKKEVTKRERG